MENIKMLGLAAWGAGFAVLVSTLAVLPGWSAQIVQAQESSSPYAAVGPVDQGWPANALLVYSGYYASSGLMELGGEATADGKFTRADDGDWLPGDFRPYVTHLDANGEPDDTFFDTFIFLAISSDRGRQFGGEFGQDQASLWPDWQWYIQRLFAPGKQLAALDLACAGAARALHQPDLRVNVYIMIPYPSYKVTDFQRPGAASSSLLPVNNRIAAIQAYVDEVLQRWQAFAPTHLRLAGFYWMQEHVNPEVPGEEQMVTTAARYVHQKGYKLGWVPWSGAYLATAWQKYGFDWAVTQPNHLFQDQPGLLAAAAQRARSAHMGVEIELDGRVQQPAGARKFYDYLDAGVRYGFMGRLIVYYQDVCMLARLYWAGGALRQMYDDVYAFAKGTYPQPTPAAVRASGRVVDESGQPVAQARVQLGEVAAWTGKDGRFQLGGTYRGEGVLLVSVPPRMAGSSSLAADGGVAVYPITRSAPSVEALTLRARDARLLAGFDTEADVAAAMGLGLDIAATHEVATEGTGALELRPAGGWNGPAALFVDLAGLAGVPVDWSQYGALAVDVWTPPLPPGETGATGSLFISVRDEDGGMYGRSYPLLALPSGGWQTLVVPLAEAASGKEHVDLLGSGQPGGVDLHHVARLTINWQLPASGEADSAASIDHLVLDNLRLYP
ncbi:MAG: DUF4855 domain-containing protein [Limnochordaceae bacterium]|nr:DUF4855 domain-containing protein [Limnochordaceae bacterium]